MADIVVSEFMDEDALTAELGDYDVEYAPTLADRRDDLLAAVRDARALIVRNRTQVDVELLAEAPALLAVGRLGVGLDNIDMTACAERGVDVFPAYGANNQSVAEWVITAAMLLLRGAWLSTDRVAAGAWPRNTLIGRETAGKRLGLVGFGAIARETATRAAALGMQVSAFDPYVAADDAAWNGVESLSLADLTGGSDVISLHVPLNDETRDLVDAGFIDAMRDDAILVNAARGGVVDEMALCTALREGRLGGAALDVFAEEPLDAAAGARFAGVPNLLLTPHIAGVTAESNVRVSLLTARSVKARLER